MNTILKLQAATLGARTRTGDSRIGTSASNGLVRVELIIPREGRAPEVQPLTEPLPIGEAIAYLERMG